MKYKFLKYFLTLSIPFLAYMSFNSNGILTYAPILEAFLLIPLLELFFKPSTKNISDAEEEMAKDDISYDIILYSFVPIIYFLIWEFLVSMGDSISTFDRIGRILSMGLICGGFGINIAHELGHRRTKYEKLFSKILLLPSLYMHFFIEHNFGHHLKFGTPDDGATAKYNQNVYSFWITSVTKQYIDAWKKQMELLKRNGNSFISIKNDMMWYVLIQSAYLFTIYSVFSTKGLFFATAVGVISFLFLETINYIEHYGLKRKMLPSGRYERVREIHSWNSNHSIGRIVLYELTRHSDHHYKSSKKYQLLDYFDESPELPYGYPSSIILSLFPPIWFRIMNPLVPSEMKSE